MDVIHVRAVAKIKKSIHIHRPGILIEIINHGYLKLPDIKAWMQVVLKGKFISGIEGALTSTL